MNENKTQKKNAKKSSLFVISFNSFNKTIIKSVKKALNTI